jgi:hypothetical protein
MKTIFINIPSYHDPEIWQTIDNFYSNAKHPERIFFGVTNQTNAIDLHTEVLKRYPQVNMDIVKPGSIVGCQPARLNSHKFYKNEDYYLNMDSHMRSIKNWDQEIIDDFESLQGSRGKSVITAYAPGYDKDSSGDDIILDIDFSTMFYMSESNVDNFKKNGIPQFCAYNHHYGVEIPSPYISGHFFFTSREAILAAPFVKEVMFTEEEIFMAVRFFTAGYNIFTPKKAYVYHRYGRGGRRLFWEDFPELWNGKDKESRDFVLNILENNLIQDNGILKIRTLQEFEEYSGISFKTRELSEKVISGKVSLPESQ